jgi:hypothetical protein
MLQPEAVSPSALNDERSDNLFHRKMSCFFVVKAARYESQI